MVAVLGLERIGSDKLVGALKEGVVCCNFAIGLSFSNEGVWVMLLELEAVFGDSAVVRQTAQVAFLSQPLSIVLFAEK